MDDILDTIARVGIVVGGFVALFGIMHLQAWSMRKKKDR